MAAIIEVSDDGFPFLFGGAFIEGIILILAGRLVHRFPFLFGGAFIEGRQKESA